MLFSSWNFIVYFLPVVLLTFYVIPSSWRIVRKIWLILASLFFYGYWKIDYVPLLVLSIMANFAVAEGIIRLPGKSRAILIAGVTLNLLLLGYFKYTDFAVSFLGHVAQRDLGHVPATPFCSRPNMNSILSSAIAGVLAEFISWARANHVTVLFTFPNVIHHPEYDAPHGRQTVLAITHFFTSQDVPIIGTAGEAMLPINQFYDTIYHLTYEAALKRTERLIPELKPYLHAQN